MKIWHVSDTHTYHGLLNVPDDIDIVIHSGDCSNPSNPYNNEPEVRDFIHWFKSLPIKHKIYVAGNHDTSIEKGLITKKDFKITNLPENCVIKIYNISGKLIRTFKKASPLSFVDWDLKNNQAIPIASGVYLIHVEVEGVGSTVIKFFGGMRQIDLETI